MPIWVKGMEARLGYGKVWWVSLYVCMACGVEKRIAAMSGTTREWEQRQTCSSNSLKKEFVELISMDDLMNDYKVLNNLMDFAATVRSSK